MTDALAFLATIFLVATLTIGADALSSTLLTL